MSHTKHPFRVGYSSFPGWSTLGEIRELELERGNEFPDISRLDPSWPAKWVAGSKLIAYGYVLPASEWERVTSGKLTADEREDIENTVFEVPIQEGDIFLVDDGDGGYLVVRPDSRRVSRLVSPGRFPVPPICSMTSKRTIIIEL